MDQQTRLEILNDPVYGPNSPFFWPGTVRHAEILAFYEGPFDYRSTKDFLEKYKDSYSGVKNYIENIEDPEEEEVDKLYAHFDKLYHGIESWPFHTFFVSALYRMIFHDIFPYQSKRYDVPKRTNFEYLEKAYLSKGRYDEAIKFEFFQSLEEIQQDKETDKVGGRISETTWYHLTRILLDPKSDPLVFPEVIRFIRVLEQDNLVDGWVKKDLLFLLERRFSCDGPVDIKSFSENYLVCLSLLQIPTEKSEQAIQRSLEEKSYRPLIDLIETDESWDFPH